MTTGDSVPVVRASPKNREVVHPCGSQRGSQATGLCLRPWALPYQGVDAAARVAILTLWPGLQSVDAY